jgi:hypothetical protein
MRDPQPPLEWLPEDERLWVARHQAVLEAIVAAFQREQQWPDPVALERDLRSRGTKIGLLAAVNSVPPSLGRREHGPGRVVLTLFGLACVPDAAWMLESYVAALRLALVRFDEPMSPAVLTRADLQEHLKLADTAMDIVSRVILLPGNPFLADGQSSVDAWRCDIDERIVHYEHVVTVDALMTELARQRLTPSSHQSPSEAQSPHSTTPGTRESESSPAITAGLAMLALGSNVIALLTAAPPLAVAVFAASLAAVLLHRRLLRTRPSYVAVLTVAVVGLSAAGLAWIVESTGVFQGRNPHDASGPLPAFTQTKCMYDVSGHGDRYKRAFDIRRAGKIEQEFIATEPYILSLDVIIGINGDINPGWSPQKTSNVRADLLDERRDVVGSDVRPIVNNGTTTFRFAPPVKVRMDKRYWVSLQNKSRWTISPYMRYNPESTDGKPPGAGRTLIYRGVDRPEVEELKDALVGCVQGARRTQR